MTASRLEKLRRFIHEVDRLHREHYQTAPLLDVVAQWSAALMRYNDWLPEGYALPHPRHYQQYLLHTDSRERFSIVSFVWGPGQATPVRDHRVWGATGTLRDAEKNQRYQLDANGIPRALGVATLLGAGQVGKVSADGGDIHRASNALADRASISIHIYGGNIGVAKCAVCTPGGQQKPFISGCSDRHLPSIWDLSHGHQG